MSEKANFKAWREMLGILQKDIAEEMGVNILSVKKWENPDYKQCPPERAWEILERAQKTQEQLIEESCKIVGGHKAIQMNYFRDQAMYDEYGRDKGSVCIANANVRAAAQVLVSRGVKVEFSYPVDKDNIYHEKRNKK
jgi:hypothetical protein